MSRTNPLDALHTPAGCVPGPHLCSKVGTNVSTILHTALMELCDRRHGQLSKLEIDHVFDLVLNSSALFSVYQGGYSKCVGLKNSPQFVEIDEAAVTRFVVGAFCRDVVADCFARQIEAAGSDWARMCAEGFEGFLAEAIAPDLPRDLFAAYQKLVAQYPGALTPVTILNSETVVGVTGRAISALRSRARGDAVVLRQLVSAMNIALKPVVRSSEAPVEAVDQMTASTFLKRMMIPSVTNPFRNLVLNRPGSR